MTHDIVAEFSFSLWKPSEKARAESLGFHVGDFKQYHVVSGSVFSEEYNETLDSGILVLSQIQKEDRLAKIKSYEFVRVFDKSSAFNPLTGKYKFDKIYFIDSFDEKENNIKEHIFGYTIDLMSETKILEKIQCPNLTITHDIKNGVSSKKMIWEYIDRYMRLFVPKIKFSLNGGQWNYEYLIHWHTKEIHSYSGTQIVSFSATDFEQAEVFGYYILNLESPELVLGEEYDYSSIEVKTITSSGIDLQNVHASFERETHKFIIYGETRNLGSGTVTISYRYSTLSALTDFAKRFNVPCADLSFNCPTLRQLLTTLMQQVGCIPVVRNRTLEYLDFQKDAVPFGNGDYTLNNTVNFIRRSLSSDSFVNTLVNVSEQVLDSGNEVICETVGFRDRKNVLLKQTENLKIETSLPIYKVNKFIFHAPGRYTGKLIALAGCKYRDNIDDSGTDATYDPIWNELQINYEDLILDVANNRLFFRIEGYFGSPFNNTSHFVRIYNNKIYFLGRKENGGYKVLSSIPFDDFELTLENTQLINHRRVRDFEFTNIEIPEGAVGFCFSGVSTDNTSGSYPFSVIKFDDNDSNVQVANSNATYNLSFGGDCKWDLSKLVVENSARQFLETDFVKMVGNGIEDDENEYGELSNSSRWTVENLSKYIYGTVGYSIGSKEISGFSDVFIAGEGTSLGWVQRNYTYLENIINMLGTNFNDVETILTLSDYFEFLKYLGYVYASKYGPGSVFPNPNLANMSFKWYNPLNNGDFTSTAFFSTCFVDIYYQPLNSFNLSYVKSQEDIDYPLEQYDSNASGLTDFDRLSIHEQEQVDRVGNETLFISQRTVNADDVQNFDNGPLIYRDDVNRDGEIEGEESVDYIIFKRSFTIENNCINVSYVGSKDAVLKNYFTSIRTKYRAYQYVDYAQSVLRKEKDVLYIRIANNFYDGDNKIRSGSNNCLSNFVYDLKNDAEQIGYKRNISYEIESDAAKIPHGTGDSTIENQTVKNSVSLVSTDNMFGIIYEYMDNVGAGPYLLNISKDKNLGGVPQSYHIWAGEYNEYHDVKFTSYIDFYSFMARNDSNANNLKSYIKANIEKIEKSPVVDGFSFSTMFSVVFNKKLDNFNLSRKRLFYKDYAERINHTVQFIYYAPNKDVLIGEDFISGCPAINRYANNFNAIVTGDLEDFKLNKDPYNYVEEGNRKIIDRKEWHEPGEELENVDFCDGIIRFDSNEEYSGVPYFEILWPLVEGTQNNEAVSVLKLCNYNSETNELIDIAVFRRNNTKIDYVGKHHSFYFFMINDTKTDYVLSAKNGILYRKYKVATCDQENETDLERNVVDLYPVEQED